VRDQRRRVPFSTASVTPEEKKKEKKNRDSLLEPSLYEKMYWDWVGKRRKREKIRKQAFQSP